MAVTEKTKRLVWATSGSTCAICHKFLVLAANESGPLSLVGDVAHIHAKRDGGPRSALEMPPEDRDKEPNLFLLCLDHHKVVDDHPEEYPPQKLREIKTAHAKWVQTRFASGKPWSSNLQNYFYINLPRILMLAELQGTVAADPFAYLVKDIQGLGGNYLSFLRAIKPVIESLHPNTAPLEDLPLDESSVGRITSFNGRFYTKNLSKALMGKWSGFCGELNKDPHIYFKRNGSRIVMPIDPRWLTTTTAGVHLSSGQGVFAGICIVNSPLTEDGVVYGSPLLIGHPKH